MIKKLLAIGLLGSFWLASGSAYAITPGNLSLNNVATLTYTGNPTGIQAEAAVTVNVVAAQPVLVVPGDITKAENQTITTESQYTVTAANNGFDTYNFVPTALTDGNGLTDTSSGGANVDFTNVDYVYKDADGNTVTSIGLGASALDVISTATNTITVPSDGTADSSVNGLEQDDTVVIGGVAYTITGAVNDTGTGSVTLTLNTAVPASLPVGTGVFERTTFTVETNGSAGVGNQLVEGNDTTYDVTTTLQTTLLVGGQQTVVDTFQVTIVNVTIVKYVRNISRDNCTLTGTATACGVDATHDSGDGSGALDYYLTAGTSDEVNARPGEELAYLIRVSTPASGALVNAVIADVLADFTSFNSGSLRMNGQVVEDEGTANNPDGNGSTLTFPLDPATDDGGLLIQDGNPASGEGDGDVAGSSTVNIVYRVTLS